MKSSLPLVALVAVASSVATVLVMDAFRAPTTAPAATAVQPTKSVATAEEREAPATLQVAAKPTVVEASTAAPVIPALDEAQLKELERRIAALELGMARRASRSTEEEPAPPEQDLRDLVLAWVAEDRERLWKEEGLEEAQAELAEMEFEARYRAYSYKRKYDLTDWEEAKLVETFLEVDRRSRELEESFDLETDDPEAIEARWEEFDQWAEQYEKDNMGPDLYRRIEEGFEDEWEDDDWD